MGSERKGDNSMCSLPHSWGWDWGLNLEEQKERWKINSPGKNSPPIRFFYPEQPKVSFMWSYTGFLLQCSSSITKSSQPRQASALYRVLSDTRSFSVSASLTLAWRVLYLQIDGWGSAEHVLNSSTKKNRRRRRIRVSSGFWRLASVQCLHSWIVITTGQNVIYGFWRRFEKWKYWPSEKAGWVKGLVTELDNLSLIPGTHVVEGENWFI